MSWALMLVLQAAVPPPAPALAPIDFDLARYRPGNIGPATARGACGRGDPVAIVVCGRRSRSGAAYPLDEMAAIFDPRPLVAETGLIGNLRARAYVEGVEIAPGLVSNRLMIGIRLPF